MRLLEIREVRLGKVSRKGGTLSHTMTVTSIYETPSRNNDHLTKITLCPTRKMYNIEHSTSAKGNKSLAITQVIVFFFLILLATT